MFKRMFKGDAGNVFKGMLTLLVGASFARVVGLLSIPILTRIYSPEDFGVLALYAAFIVVLVPVMTLRYVQAIPLPKTDIMAFNLFSVCLKLIGFFSIVLILVLAVWAEPILGWFDMGALLPWWWLIVIGVIGAALYELFSLWATRKKDYKVIAKTQFSQSLIGNIAKIGFGLLELKPFGLIAGQFLSQSAGITGFIKAASQDFKTYLPGIKKSKERLVVKYYQDFVWYRLPSQFLMVLSVQAPVMMIAVLYTSEQVGQFGLAKMALMVPAGLIGAAISNAYYAEVASIGKRDYGKIKKITWAVQKKVLVIAAAPLLIFSVFSPALFSLIFGDEWVVAGQYARVLTPYIILMLVSTPLVQVLNIVGSQRVFLVINVARVLMLGALFGLAKVFEMTAFEFVVWFSFVSVGYSVFQMAMVVLYVNRAAQAVQDM
ncbi:lipopolysaccharide biosynthesis protein [Halopseudomonas xiamenensis]|uniref:lipopolysaccharide biosynthesis protein n=1 Tax=Halopseudomonas xiamenensis TaxID=157792 RepID=UPI0016295051|nr:oligosaccharide flippase family protein [Halopseudomonas xiamenensis]